MILSSLLQVGLLIINWCYGLLPVLLNFIISLHLVVLICLPDGRRVVALCPPGLWWVEVPTPQLPVEALGGQRVLLDLEGVILDVVKGGRHHAGAILLYSLQDRFCPVRKHNMHVLKKKTNWNPQTVAQDSNVLLCSVTE